tara:strand:- start:230 stop:454 length:225 start_codon:yes stop_codon:yes gene_type:complete
MTKIKCEGTISTCHLKKNQGAATMDDKKNSQEITDKEDKKQLRSKTLPVETGGPKGLEPTRYGDWEKNGRCIDF